MKPNTLTRRAYEGKIYVQNIRKNSCRIRNRIRIRSKSFRIQGTTVGIRMKPTQEPGDELQQHILQIKKLHVGSETGSGSTTLSGSG